MNRIHSLAFCAMMASMVGAQEIQQNISAFEPQTVAQAQQRPVGQRPGNQGPQQGPGQQRPQDGNVKENARQGNRFSPEEFRQRQRQYMTEKAELTTDEAERFFPLFFELQDKKNQINRESRQNAHNRQQRGQVTEEECRQMLDKLADAKLRIAKLEKDYLIKYEAVIPASKILKLQMAENDFGADMLKEMQHRNDAPSRFPVR